MSRYMLESDLPQYLNEKHYVVRDHEGKLIGVLHVDHDWYGLIECVEEIPPERPAEPPSLDGIGPSTAAWDGVSYEMSADWGFREGWTKQPHPIMQTGFIPAGETPVFPDELPGESYQAWLTRFLELNKDKFK